ncbi:autophagy-related protein 16-1-like [Oscarella lobularis]|uniref:autophagy-related protein 16-1-like n=1 Tax=Oscarella lobularis TaxID=121494 RepID=UPI00331404A4
MAATASGGFRGVLLRDLKARNKREADRFADIVHAHNRLFERVATLKAANRDFERETMRLREELEQAALRGGGGGGGTRSAADKDTIFKLQSELTEMHRRKGEVADRVIELTEESKKKEDEIKRLTDLLNAVNVDKNRLQADCQSLRVRVEEIMRENNVLKDEQQALQLAYLKLDEMVKKLKTENRDLVDRWMMQKAQDADKVNLKNEADAQKRQVKLQDELQDAARPIDELHTSVAASALAKIKDVPAALLRRFSKKAQSNPDNDDVMEHVSRCFSAILPVKSSHKFDAHDGEVVTCRFSSTGRYLATGGADRKLKLWEVAAGKAFDKGVFIGSNAGVTSAEFDLHEKVIVGASNDHSARVWGLNDQRLRHTLTGHSGKVMTAKFLSDGAKIVTGSHDRTLKVWDLRGKSCFRTIFAGSSCNDLVVNDGSGPSIISGHFDKRIRFWDIRSESSANEISLQGKVTSLDLSPDRTLLLSSSRDDTLKLIDLRMNQVTGTFSADGLKIGTDYSRACFSPDGEYVAAGSHDGSLFVWRTQTGKFETSVREHSACVVACAWHPSGSLLASTDRNKKCVLWTN